MKEIINIAVSVILGGGSVWVLYLVVTAGIEFATAANPQKRGEALLKIIQSGAVLVLLLAGLILWYTFVLPIIPNF
jgi:uncharacterized membrane protein YdjX (TVP38/TMEM64 family)